MIKIVVNNIKGDINIKINEKDIFEQDTLVNINEIYKNSLNVLSFELDLVSLTTKEMKDSSFYWCHTYDIHRDDGIKGTVLYYFINELIKELVKLDNEIELHTNFYIPNSIKSILINNGAKLTTSVNLIDRLKYFFRYNLGSIKYLVKYLRLISIKSKIIKDLDIVLFTNIESNIKRWRGFPDTIVECGSDLNLIDNQLMRLKNYNTNEI